MSLPEYLLRIPGLKILRIYGDTVEQSEFPIPNKLQPGRKTRTKAELAVSPNLREIALHHVIRKKAPGNSFASKLQKFEERFEEMQLMGEKPNDQMVEEYTEVFHSILCKILQHIVRACGCEMGKWGEEEVARPGGMETGNKKNALCTCFGKEKLLYC